MGGASGSGIRALRKADLDWLPGRVLPMRGTRLRMVLLSPLDSTLPLRCSRRADIFVDPTTVSQGAGGKIPAACMSRLRSGSHNPDPWLPPEYAGLNKTA